MLKNKLLLIFLLITKITSAQLYQKFDSLFQTFHAYGLFDGTALVADSTGIVYQKSFGIANHDYKIPNDSKTIYRIGSLEKQFTAMLVMQFIEKGKLDINGKIIDYLPHYRKETGSLVTIKHLLTHSSGIPNYTALPNVWNDSLKLHYQPEYILRNFCSGDLEFQPGTKYAYSNTDYFILAQILEQISQKALSILLQENIFLPAGMKHSGLDDPGFPVPNKALGYYRLSHIFLNEPYIYVPNTKGAASMYATAHDLYAWDRILYTNKLLSSENLLAYSSPQFNISSDYAYGYGWEFTRTILDDTVQTMEHSGAIRAFRANLFRIPAEKKCIILLSNSANQSAYELFENCMKIFRGGKWNVPKKVLADTLYSVIQNASVVDAIQTYKTLQNSNPDIYDFGSYDLELLGERLLLLQNYAAATAIFKLAVEEDPDYGYGYLYLGRAYEKWGKPQKAIQAYQTAVSKNKNSRPGRDAAFQIRYLETQK